MYEPISFTGMYSDGTPMVKTPGFARIVDKAHTMVVRPHSLNEFVVAMFLHDAIMHRGGKVKRLVLPYVPGARQDRVNPTGDVLYTAWSVCEMINLRAFQEVVILDPHSPVVTNEIVGVTVYPLRLVANQFEVNPWDAVIAPDKGGQARAEEMAESLHQSVVYASKVRDVATGRLSGFDVDVDAGCHYLVSDDICDGGGTFIGLGEKIREQGATADLFVSHGLFSKATRELKKIYNTIYTTDSLEVHDRNDVTILPVVKEMENYNA
jgi:ribose-phosphate pyrophosphokinase